MSLISTSIANLINGVSQQPNALRLASQCEVQINCESSVVEGLKGRNGTRHVSKIASAPWPNAYSHVINRDRGERYRLIIRDMDLTVYDLATGTSLPVTFPNGKGYLSAPTTIWKDHFVSMTVADYTFILNKSKVAAQSFELLPNRSPEALIWVKQSTAASKYTVTINGVTGTYTCGKADEPLTQGTDAIALGLANSLNDNLGGTRGDWQVFPVGSVLYIKRSDNQDFIISVTDSLGDNGTTLLKGKTQRFSNLPARGWPDFVVEVEGESSSFGSSYFVKFVSEPTNQYGGVWRECPKPNERCALDPSTMPHVLVREANGTFTFRQASWEKRKVGDLENDPFPSFVGSKINDIFFHKNRLGFLSDENLIMSKASEFFDFFKGSALQILDTDPIDIGASHTKVSILRYAVPFNESLLLFSDQTQFLLGKTADILTAKSASLDQTTEFECSPRVKPVGVGSNVYFAQNREAWSAIREFTVDNDTQTKDAQDTTNHVPKYIPSDVFKITASTTEQIIVALSDKVGYRNKLFVYQYHNANGTKLQSAWHTWQFGAEATILQVDFIESTLHLLVSRPDGVYIEILPCQPGMTEDDQPFSVHMDRIIGRSQVTGYAYFPASQQTHFIPPFTTLAGETYTLIAWKGSPGYKVGTKLEFSTTPTNSKGTFWINYATNTVVVNGSSELSTFRFGRQFLSLYQFSQLLVKEEAKGGGQVAVSEGRINVRRMRLVHGRSGYFRVKVQPRGKPGYQYIMSARTLGSNDSLLGDVAIKEGVFPFPVQSRNTEVTITLETDSWQPFAILSADWEAMYVVRSRRI